MRRRHLSYHIKILLLQIFVFTENDENGKNVQRIEIVAARTVIARIWILESLTKCTMNNFIRTLI